MRASSPHPPAMLNWLNIPLVTPINTIHLHDILNCWISEPENTINSWTFHKKNTFYLVQCPSEVGLNHHLVGKIPMVCWLKPMCFHHVWWSYSHDKFLTGCWYTYPSEKLWSWSVGMMTAKMSLPILAIFCTSFCISCQIQQLQHLSIAAAPFPNQDWGTIPAEHDKEKNQRPQLRWDSLLAPAHKQVMSPRGCKL